MIDLHCHILHNIDDGPDNLDESVELARIAVEDGTHTIVATPHISWDYPENDAAKIAGRVRELRRALRKEKIPLRIEAGAEVALTRAVDLPDAELDKLRLGDSAWILIECPLTQGTASGFEAGVAQIAARGHSILLAHPERSPVIQADPSALERMVRDGARAQITSGALVGRFGKTVQRFAEDLITEGYAHDVSSDGHSAVRRPPTLATELEEAGFESVAEWLGNDMALAMLEGTPAPMRPELVRAHGASAKRGAGRLGRLLGRS